MREPMKVGAVVEDAQGNLFIRHTTASLAPWIGASTNVDHNPDRPYRYWSGTKAVVIHSEGVVPT